MIEFVYLHIKSLLKIVSMSRSIAGFSERLSDKRLTFLKEALAMEALDAPTGEILIEEINQTVFRRITRITANKAMRERINFIVNASKGEVHINQFFYARNYLQIQDDKLVAIPTITTIKDEKEARCNKWGAWGMALVSVGSFVLAGFIEVTTFQIVFLLSGVIIILLVLVMANRGFSYGAAKLLQPELKRLQK